MKLESSDIRSPWDYVLVAGSGGSGSKRLLRIFDQSTKTHCRNEPYNNLGSPFAQLRSSPRAWVLAPDDLALLDREWDAAVRWTAARMGDRDTLPPPPKGHFLELGTRLGLLRLLSSRTARRLTRVVPSGGLREEWRVPRFIARRGALERSLLVMKFNQAPALMRWVLQRRPRVKIIHLVRHPAGYLASWQTRLLSRADREAVTLANRERLRVIAAARPEWAATFGPLEERSAEELELLFWLYDTRSICEAGSGKAQYELVLDEDISIGGFDVAKRLYASCGLEWEEGIETWLADSAANWRARTLPWRGLLKPAEVAIIEELLGKRDFEGWWSPDQLVSRIDYHWR